MRTFAFNVMMVFASTLSHMIKAPFQDSVDVVGADVSWGYKLIFCGGFCSSVVFSEPSILLFLVSSTQINMPNL